MSKKKVNWFADDERGILYVRVWDADQGVWAREMVILRLSQVAQLLDRMQIMPNALDEGHTVPRPDQYVIAKTYGGGKLEDAT